jgi:SAM-dependent methyltransferase
MGVAWSLVRKMDELGLLNSNTRILDIGSSNLYSAQSEEIEAFLMKYGSGSKVNIKDFSKRLADGSRYDPIKGGCNESFIGEVFEEAGMHYTAFDIADGYRTTITDLNRDELPEALKNSFDLVLNFGTTEHILNQLNCFKVIHEATRVGGYIFHSLPASGYVDHGYLTYTGRCFFDLARFNKYEIVACWFDGPAGYGSVLESLENHSSYFPVLKKSLKDLANSEQGKKVIDLKIPNVGIYIICRKVEDNPFSGTLEFSTSVGIIPKRVSDFYAASKGTITQRLARTLQVSPRLYRIARKIYRIIKWQVSKA